MKKTIGALNGAHVAAALTGGDMARQLDDLAAIAPTLSRFILERGFGEVVGGAVTGFREWNLAVLAVLAAMGDAQDQSGVYLKAAVAQGATEQEVQDILHLVYLYAGAPRAVTAARRMSAYLARARADTLADATEQMIRLRDHHTVVWDSAGQGLPTQGTPIVLIHALDMDHRFWRLVFQVLAAKSRVIAYDIRGHGRARGRRRPRLSTSSRTIWATFWTSSKSRRPTSTERLTAAPSRSRRCCVCPNASARWR